MKMTEQEIKLKGELNMPESFIMNMEVVSGKLVKHVLKKYGIAKYLEGFFVTNNGNLISEEYTEEEIISKIEDFYRFYALIDTDMGAKFIMLSEFEYQGEEKEPQKKTKISIRVSKPIIKNLLIKGDEEFYTEEKGRVLECFYKEYRSCLIYEYEYGDA